MTIMLSIAFATTRELGRANLAIVASTSALRVQDGLDRELRLLRTEIGAATRTAERGGTVAPGTWAKLNRRLDRFARSVAQEQAAAPAPTRAAIRQVEALSGEFLQSARRLVNGAVLSPRSIKTEMPEFLKRLRAVEDARIAARDVLTSYLAEQAQRAADLAHVWQTTLTSCGVIFILAMFSVAGWLMRAVVSPITYLANAADCDSIDASITRATQRADEVGALARSVVTLTQLTAERRETLERAEFAARHDPLTGLQNRRSFESQLDAAIAGSSGSAELALLCLDLDGFKEVNDRLGHSAGDRLLEEVAEVLRRVVGDPCSIGRMGGDEFSIIQAGQLQPAGAAELSARLLQAFEDWRDVSNVAVGASIGIAIHPRDGQTPARLRHSADLALYAAKNQGRGRARHFSPDLAALEAGSDRVPLSAELPSAIKNGDLRLLYQPKLSSRTGQLDSLEALVRWQHPTRGLVCPVDFVPLAERTGQIRALTDWTLKQAIADQARLRANGMNFPVFVNISVALLSDPAFVADTLHLLLTRTGEFGLEVTETAVAADPAQAMAHLAMFVDAGLGVSIDDYGTGMSSLSYLKRLPATELKIDRCFIHQLSRSERDQLIVKSTVDLAHALGLKVIAEGVETEEDLAILGVMGCDVVQGFLLAEPMPVEQIADFAAARESRSRAGVR